jgi:hypothetical protein
MMMAMTTIARHVAIHQSTKHGTQTRRSVQQKDATSHTMLVKYASVVTTNY